MQQISAQVPLSFEVTFDSPALDVGLSIYDVSNPIPVLVGVVTAMINLVGNTYFGSFQPVFGKSYVVFKAVYTDNFLNVLSPDYAQASESFICQKVVFEDGQIVVKKNQPLSAFMFLMVDVVNQNPITGLVPTAMRSLDGGAFAACLNAVVEVGLGFYKIDLDATDLNADVIALEFSALTADVSACTILTQR
jgi:hypothetical protein